MLSHSWSHTYVHTQTQTLIKGRVVCAPLVIDVVKTSSTEALHPVVHTDLSPPSKTQEAAQGVTIPFL